jgi:hypothetical protein
MWLEEAGRRLVVEGARAAPIDHEAQISMQQSIATSKDRQIILSVLWGKWFVWSFVRVRQVVSYRKLHALLSP